MRWSKGFTLIEMLVVIAIISILIGIGVNTFTIAQKKARDTKRKADLRQSQIILEQYKLDTGKYPARSSASWVSMANIIGPGSDTAAYNTKSITDPLNTCPSGTLPLNGSTGSTAKCYQYIYYATDGDGACAGGAYLIAVSLENKDDPQTQRAPNTPGLPPERDLEVTCADGTVIDPVTSSPPDDLYLVGGPQ